MIKLAGSIALACLLTACAVKGDKAYNSSEANSKKLTKSYLYEVKYSTYKLKKYGDFILPMYIGPAKISHDDLVVKLENKDELLFNSEGIIDKLSLLMPYSEYELDFKARGFGFNTHQDMFKFIYKQVIAKDGFYLSSIVDEGFMMDKATLEAKNEQLLSIIYSYYDYNGQMNPDWYFIHENKKVSYEKKDFLPYTLAISIMEYKFKEVK